MKPTQELNALQLIDAALAFSSSASHACEALAKLSEHNHADARKASKAVSDLVVQLSETSKQYIDIANGDISLKGPVQVNVLGEVSVEVAGDVSVTEHGRAPSDEDALVAELKRGTDVAAEMIEHLSRMGAAATSIPVKHGDVEYIVSVKPAKP